MRRDFNSTGALHLLGRDAEVTPKQRTERTEALKAAVEADVDGNLKARLERQKLDVFRTEKNLAKRLN